MQNDKYQQQEELVGLKLVKERLLSEAQLSTAIDFQKAVGGSIVDVVLRLKFADKERVDRFIRDNGLQAREPERPGRSDQEDTQRDARPARRKGGGHGKDGKDGKAVKDGAPPALARPTGGDAEAAPALGSITAIGLRNEATRGEDKRRRGHDAPAREEPEAAPPPSDDETVAAAARDGESADTATPSRRMNVETAFVVDALVRILVRKGIVHRNEIKEEVLKMDTHDLLSTL